MTQLDPIAIVQAFHDHLNDHDVTGVLDLAADDIRVGGPRGAGEGKHLLEEWVGRANITMTPRRWFRESDTVVVEQQATWRDPDSGDETGRQVLATVFTIRDGLIAGIARYGFLAEAVHSANMDEANEINAPI